MININHLTDDELHAFCAGGLDVYTKDDLVHLVEILLGRLTEGEKEKGEMDDQFVESLKTCKEQCNTKLDASKVSSDCYMATIRNLASYRDRLVDAVDKNQQGVVSALLTAMQCEIDVLNKFAEKEDRERIR